MNLENELGKGRAPGEAIDLVDPEAPMNLENELGKEGRAPGVEPGRLGRRHRISGKQNYRGRNANLAEWVCWGRVGHRRLRFRLDSEASSRG